MCVLARIFALVLFFSTPAWCQSAPGGSDSEFAPIGKVMTASGTVTLQHKGAVVLQARVTGDVTATKSGDFVYRGDIVQTGSDGAIGIAFTDGTVCNLSSNARIELNDFIYDARSKNNRTLFSLTKGASTFIAGMVARTGDMKITTPVGTMGIRGTAPRVEISDNGTVSFSTLIEEGAAATLGSNQGRPAAPAQRRTRSALPSDTSPDSQNKMDRTINFRIKICKDC